MNMSYYNNNGTLKEEPFSGNQRISPKTEDNSPVPASSVTETKVKEANKRNRSYRGWRHLAFR